MERAWRVALSGAIESGEEPAPYNSCTVPGQMFPRVLRPAGDGVRPAVEGGVHGIGSHGGYVRFVMG